MNNKLYPLGDRILVKPIIEDNKQKSSVIVIPDIVTKEKPQFATVVELGTASKFAVKVGDKVLVSKYGGIEININNTEYKIYSSDDVIAILT